MSDFFPEIEIRQEQAEAIARALFAIAKADGAVHEREAAIIAEFYCSTTDLASDLGSLERSAAIEPATLALFLPTPELRRLFVKTAILMAYADSSYGKNESKLIADYAKALEISEKDLALLETQVKEYLLGQLSHLQNLQAVAEVAKELDL